jgi:Raf kinase inhibitor-like YbhB/YbcL family protein
MKYVSLSLLLTLIVAAFACGQKEEARQDTASDVRGDSAMAIRITSPAFDEGGMIPKKYTCDGDDVSPALNWEGVPDGTKSLALICDDPDAPAKTWVHWVLYNIPPDTIGLPEGVPSDTTLDNGTKHGITDFGRYGYGGPCPPSGTHRYFFKLYALDTLLDLTGKVDKAAVETAMKGHILDSGELMCRYSRK